MVSLYAIAAYGLLFLGGMGITAGAHRLWSHRAYKARLPLRIFLMLCNTMAFQNSIYEWTRDHRVHHKYTDTNADPHNSRRGFFFAHMGWLMCRKHPDVKAKGKLIDMSDLRADPVVMFQKKSVLVVPVPLFLRYLIDCVLCVAQVLRNTDAALLLCNSTARSIHVLGHSLQGKLFHLFDAALHNILARHLVGK